MGERNGLTKITAALVLVGTITAGVTWMETRYAKAADLVEVKVLILESARDSARARLFELDQTAKTRPLNPEEARRKQELLDLISDLNTKIARSGPPSTKP